MIVRPLFLVLAFAALVGGCRREPNVAVKELVQSKPDDDKTAVVLDIFRHDTSVPQVREALSLLSIGLARPDLQDRVKASAESRAILERAGLSADEISDLSAPAFRPLDAHYVDGCTLFRDAARNLEIAGLNETAQIDVCLHWVARRVLHFEQQVEGLPSAYAVRGGFGSGLDRALVAGALLHQFRIPTAYLLSPDGKNALVAVLVRNKVHVLDPRRGQMLRDANGQPATWAQIKAAPDLAKDTGLTPDQIASLEGRIIVPLESLAPRMQYLESLLQGDESHVGADRMSLFHNLPKLERDFASAGLNLTLWNPKAGDVQPLRAWRLFLPPEEGGLDRRHRWRLFHERLVPWAPIFSQYQRLGIVGEIAPPALDTLKKFTDDLFEKYYVQPHAMLVRGKVEVLPRRLDRIRTVVEDAEFASPEQERGLAKDAAAWRDRVNQLYRLVRKDPEAAARIQQLWEEDQYFVYLLQPEIEDVPRGATKKVLSRIVLSACREPMGARTNLLFAELSHDRAERLEAIVTAQKALGKEPKTVAALNAWKNARSAWAKYLDRSNLGPALIPGDLAQARQAWDKADPERAVAILETLHLQLHQWADARNALARALDRSGQDGKAALASLSQELGSLIQEGRLAKEIQRYRDQLRLMPIAAGAQETLDRRLELLSRSWGPMGSFTWAVKSP